MWPLMADFGSGSFGSGSFESPSQLHLQAVRWAVPAAPPPHAKTSRLINTKHTTSTPATVAQVLEIALVVYAGGNVRQVAVP